VLVSNPSNHQQGGCHFLGESRNGCMLWPMCTPTLRLHLAVGWTVQR
jgi:hypothetical protein